MLIDWREHLNCRALMRMHVAYTPIVTFRVGWPGLVQILRATLVKYLKAATLSFSTGPDSKGIALHDIKV